MVSMSVDTSIPAELKVAGFTLAIRYRGQLQTCYVCQEVGHTEKECPKSQKATRKRPVRKQTVAQSASSSNAKKPSQQRDVPPSCDLDLSVRLPKSAPSSSPMLTDFSRKVTTKPGKQLTVVSNKPPVAARTQGKSRHISSGSEESDDSLDDVSGAPKPCWKSFKRFANSQPSSGRETLWPSSKVADVVFFLIF